MTNIGILNNPTRFLFFTGKGGVGKTSLSAAVALSLVDLGKKVLLVSTDAASNLDEMLGVELKNSPVPVPNANGLFVLNIDPDNAAESYRKRVIDQMSYDSSEDERSNVREQLSGACTTEIAAFDEFASLLSDVNKEYDHIVFDTAPTGHTLRLLSLPKAWAGFLKDNDRGASCLGPHSGLKMQEARFLLALKALSDTSQTTIVLVTRPEKSAMEEVSRTSDELKTLGLSNQRLIINGIFKASDPKDIVATSIQNLGLKAINEMPKSLRLLPIDEIPLRAFDTVGLSGLKALLREEFLIKENPADIPKNSEEKQLGLDVLVDQLAKSNHGLIMVMGKGGVGKTTIAAALAIGLVKRGKSVHLSTTDPAAHITGTINGSMPGLLVDRIDPKVETQKYIDKIMERKGAKLNAEEKALMLEDLKSPCTEEVAVFHAFSKIVSEAQNSFVVLDTAPTGHSLLLMDATGAYHRQSIRDLSKAKMDLKKIVTPLMRLQDPLYTQIIIVTLPEITPVSQAAALQEDLRRAKIEPYAWVINKSILASGTHDVLLTARMNGERKQVERIKKGLASNIFILPRQVTPPIGIEVLSKLI
ncbi:MAG: arsenical pump-driving ATPase [Bacteriovorax sp.]|nr:arsenical pump-driving ATPase [Bacteriovorax sp.]